MTSQNHRLARSYPLGLGPHDGLAEGNWAGSLGTTARFVCGGKPSYDCFARCRRAVSLNNRARTFTPAGAATSARRGRPKRNDGGQLIRFRAKAYQSGPGVGADMPLRAWRPPSPAAEDPASTPLVALDSVSMGSQVRSLSRPPPTLLSCINSETLAIVTRFQRHVCEFSLRLRSLLGHSRRIGPIQAPVSAPKNSVPGSSTGDRFDLCVGSMDFISIRELPILGASGTLGSRGR
jgi:hypothetical protein